MDSQTAGRSVAPGAGRSSLLRGALLWGGGPLVLAALILGVLFLERPPEPPTVPAPCEPSPQVGGRTQRAAQAAMAGNLALARSEVEATLAEAPCHAPALLLLASVALEEGRGREVEEAVTRLKALRPERPEPKLLERMLAHRQSPGAGWRRAFLSAWAEVGTPDLRGSPLLPEVEADDDALFLDAWRRASSVPVRLALVLAAASPTEEQARWLLGQVPALEDPALVIAVDGVVRGEQSPATLRREAAPVLDRKLSQLVQTHPRSMQLRLLHLLGDTDRDAALGSKDFEALEAVAALPEWKAGSFTRTFQQARRHLEEAGMPDTGGGALTVATLSVTDRGSYLLRRRASATRDGLLPGARHRLGRILHGVGARMAAESTLVERMVGLQLMAEGAADMQDETEGERIDALLDEAHSALSAGQRAALDRWPLPSLHEEMLEASAHDEWSHLRVLAKGQPDGGPH